MSYASKRKQSSSEDEGGGANWMDTYGDLVTLLLCFFVLLFAFSSMDSAKWEALVAALAGSPMTISATSIDMTATIVDPIQRSKSAKEQQEGEESQAEMPEDFSSLEDVFFELHVRLEEFVDLNNLAASVEADYDAFILVVRFNENVFFNSGQADILPEAISVLDKMAEFFEGNDALYMFIDIEGHTDNNPISTQRFPSNNYLSAWRAVTVQEYLLNTGKIDRGKIKNSGYGEEHPIADNSTAEGRALNRRVDFVIQGLKPA